MPTQLASQPITTGLVPWFLACFLGRHCCSFGGSRKNALILTADFHRPLWGDTAWSVSGYLRPAPAVLNKLMSGELKKMKSRVSTSRRTALVSALLVFVANCAFAVELATMQSWDAFQAAMQGATTSPFYVMFTVIDAQSAQRRTVCTTPTGLGAAVHREQDLKQGGNVHDRPRDLVLSNKSRVFRFHEQSLEQNRINTEEGLQAARKSLEGLSAKEIKDRFGLMGRSRVFYDRPTQSAFACALIERGFSPRMADMTSDLYIEQCPRYDDRFGSNQSVSTGWYRLKAKLHVIWFQLKELR